MNSRDRTLRFLFVIAFLLAAFTLTLITSYVIVSTAQESVTLLSPLSPWEQGILIIKIILDCMLVFFTAMLYILAIAFSISELLFQAHHFRQPADRTSYSSLQVGSQQVPPHRQRRRVSEN